MTKNCIDLAEFLPKEIHVAENRSYPLSWKGDDTHLCLSYTTSEPKEYSLTIARYLAKTERTFEVMGLLQAEMGKTQNGCLSFSNHEYNIINKVMSWFAEAFELPYERWRWSVKLNINEPIDKTYKEQIEKKVIDHWMKRTKISKEKAYPKIVTYVNENYTKNKTLAFHDHGTLVLEYKVKLFSDIVKYFVKKVTYEKILTFDQSFIRGFMRGIIAGEGCVENGTKGGHYRVHITAVNRDERIIYQQCFMKIDINAACPELF